MTVIAHEVFSGPASCACAVRRPSLKPGRGARASALQNRRYPHATGGTHGDEPALGVGVVRQQLSERRDDACAGRSERMAYRDAAAFDVELRAIDAAQGLLLPQHV